jgi:hypothetical protein
MGAGSRLKSMVEKLMVEKTMLKTQGSIAKPQRGCGPQGPNPTMKPTIF